MTGGRGLDPGHGVLNAYFPGVAPIASTTCLLTAVYPMAVPGCHIGMTARLPARYVVRHALRSPMPRVTVAMASERPPR